MLTEAGTRIDVTAHSAWLFPATCDLVRSLCRFWTRSTSTISGKPDSDLRTARWTLCPSSFLREIRVRMHEDDGSHCVCKNLTDRRAPAIRAMRHGSPSSSASHMGYPNCFRESIGIKRQAEPPHADGIRTRDRSQQVQARYSRYAQPRHPRCGHYSSQCSAKLPMFSDGGIRLGGGNRVNVCSGSAHEANQMIRLRTRLAASLTSGQTSSLAVNGGYMPRQRVCIDGESSSAAQPSREFIRLKHRHEFIHTSKAAPMPGLVCGSYLSYILMVFVLSVFAPGFLDARCTG